MLRLEAGGVLLERVASLQRLARQVVLALLDRQLRTPLPLVCLGLVVLVPLVELLLVGDRGRNLRLDLQQLVVHVRNQLPDELLGIFGPIDHVVDVGSDERGDAVQNSHMR